MLAAHDAQIDHCIAAVPFQELLQNLAWQLQVVFPHQVNWVGAAPIVRKELVHKIYNLLGQLRQLQAVLGAEVSCDHPPASAQGDNGDPVPLGQGQGGKRSSQIQKIHGPVDLDDPGLPAKGLKDLAVAAHGSGMAGGCLVPGLAFPPFEQDHRFFLGQFLGALHKAPAVLDAFHVQHHGLGQGVHSKGVQIILYAQHGLVARAAKPSDADALLLGKAKQLHSHVSGLGHHGNGPRLGVDHCASAMEVNMRIADAHGVGAQDQDASLPGLVHQLLLQLSAFFPCLCKARGDQDHAFDALGLQLRDELNSPERRDGDHSQVHFPWNLRQTGIDLVSGDPAPFGIDWIDIPLVAAA